MHTQTYCLSTHERRKDYLISHIGRYCSALSSVCRWQSFLSGCEQLPTGSTNQTARFRLQIVKIDQRRIIIRYFLADFMVYKAATPSKELWVMWSLPCSSSQRRLQSSCSSSFSSVSQGGCSQTPPGGQHIRQFNDLTTSGQPIERRQMFYYQ